ncbi:Por secretion system C-terminal sorting domain-containing protein [Ekhidna lutea]|uniref:Por secretion system C-terminal sorting domain-containing protein n=1 Tax=Ekhidna lutea TaxID=447679 RepID=A0A239LH66_EKHLU|nr:T9SS type A sorting domain-containing protein [Ekhidna lutea]SNT28894.1 Por secretion system C-terminal sorting domain-containing protein [Ekhidna lutea]
MKTIYYLFICIIFVGPLFSQPSDPIDPIYSRFIITDNKSQKIEMKYSQSKLLTERIIFTLDSSINRWIPQSKVENDYNVYDSVTNIRYYYYSNEAETWIQWRDDSFTYDGRKLILEEVYTWEESGRSWQPQSKIELIYDTSGLLIENAKYFYSSIDELWLPSFKTVYEFDSVGNRNRWHYSSAFNNKYEWGDPIRYYEIFNELGQITKIEDYNGSTLFGTEIYQYNSLGKISLFEEYHYDDKTDRIEYYYDALGLLSREVRYKYGEFRYPHEEELFDYFENTNLLEEYYLLTYDSFSYPKDAYRLLNQYDNNNFLIKKLHMTTDKEYNQFYYRDTNIITREEEFEYDPVGRLVEEKSTTYLEDIIGDYLKKYFYDPPKTQEIDFPLPEFFYVNSNQKMDANATSELQITYIIESENAELISKDTLLITNEGEVKITATQEGNGFWQEANPVSITFNSTILSSNFKNNSKIYPNPANNSLSIEIEEFQKASIYDLKGKEIQTSNRSKFDLYIPSGTYLLRIKKTNGSIISIKLVKN